jgi:hypothetical protein
METKVGVQIEARRRAVLVSLHMEKCPVSLCTLAHAGVLSTLEDLKKQDAVKWIRSRYDRFVVMPQDDWAPQELAVAIKQRLRP